MVRSKELQLVSDEIRQQRLGRALMMLENYLLTHQQKYDNMERLKAIKADYELMADYWRRGFQDPDRSYLYHQLLRRADVLCTNLEIHHRIRNNSFLLSMYTGSRNRRKEWSVSMLRTDLENYVSEQVVLGLEPEHTRKEKLLALHRDHQQLMSDLFDYLWTSRCWNVHICDAFRDILLSPTVDSNDQQLVLSAVTLSAINAFDYYKFLLMADVYRQSTDEQVRQRALVGWVFALDDSRMELYPELQQEVVRLTSDDRCRRELKELQQQLVFCKNAERDNEMIQKEIMPDLIKNSHYHFTRNGIVEKEDDPMEDILHPEASEEAMERMEAGYRKMMDMQQHGSDIYFGGFSQMKRFPFFQQLSNWFVPFYLDHPAIAAVTAHTNNDRLLQLMLTSAPFCNSDKYSFALAFDQVLQHLPGDVRQMMERGEARLNEMAIENMQTPAYLRRTYLQDLYRFFRLHPQRAEFKNPFENVNFFAMEVFRGTPLEEVRLDVASFFLRKRMPAEASDVLGCSLVETWKQVVEYKPAVEWPLLGYARALFAEKQYVEALAAYDKLLQLAPDKKNYLLNKAVCLLNLNRYEDAQALLFQLDYNYPDDDNVSRVLAWALMCNAKYDQASVRYDRLLTAAAPASDDLLNYGYCLWFSGDIVSAVGMFRQYVSQTNASMDDMEQEMMQTEHHFIVSHGIDDSEIQLMLDSLC